MAILVCRDIKEMKIAPNSRNKCLDCGKIVGITKASEQAFEKEKIKEYVCIECFLKRKLKMDDEFVLISDAQKKELMKYLKMGGK